MGLGDTPATDDDDPDDGGGCKIRVAIEFEMELCAEIE